MEYTPKQKKFLLIAAGLVGAYALYVGYKRKQAEAASASAGTSGGGITTGGITTVSADYSSSFSDLSKALTALGTKQDANATALSNLFGAGSQDTVNAIKGQSDAFVASLKTLGDAESKAFTDLSKGFSDGIKSVLAQNAQGTASVTSAINQLGTDTTGGFATLGDKIKAAFDAQTQSLKAALDAITNGMGDLTSKAAETSKGVADANTALGSLMANLDFNTGSQSVAACIAADGSVDFECTKTHAIDLPSAGFDSKKVVQYVKQTYPQCYTGSRPDLACVGAALRTARQPAIGGK